jgi:hypothetical protein
MSQSIETKVVDGLNSSGFSSIKMSPLASPRPHVNVGNNIGDGGAKALAGYLKPHENPDGSWCLNQAMQELDLTGQSFTLSLFPIFLPRGSPSSQSS